MLDRPPLLQVPTLKVHCPERLRVRNVREEAHGREAALGESKPIRPRSASMLERVVFFEVLIAHSRRLIELGEVWELVVEGSLLGGSGLLALLGCSTCVRGMILGFLSGGWDLRAWSQSGRLSLPLAAASSCCFMSGLGFSGSLLLVHSVLWRILAASAFGSGARWCYMTGVLVVVLASTCEERDALDIPAPPGGHEMVYSPFPLAP